MTELGYLYDRSALLVMEHPQIASNLEKKVKEKLEAKQLPNLQIEHGKIKVGREVLPFVVPGEMQEHLLIQQLVGNGMVATVAVGVAKQGREDVRVWWLLFEGNASTAMIKGIGGGAMMVLGAATLISDFFAPGVGRIGRTLLGLGNRVMEGRHGDPYQPASNEALALARTIHHVIYRALDELGVDRDFVQELAQPNSQ